MKKEVEGLALLKDDGLGDKTSAPTLNSLIFTTDTNKHSLAIWIFRLATWILLIWFTC